jgi:hypothetical protein
MEEPVAQETVTFTVPDLSPDTKLEVYHTTFEAHSLALRLHSGFFRKFLVKMVVDTNESHSHSGFIHHLMVKDDGDVWGFQPIQQVGRFLASVKENCLRHR